MNRNWINPALCFLLMSLYVKRTDSFVSFALTDRTITILYLAHLYNVKRIGVLLVVRLV